MIEIKNVSKTYNGTKKALDNVNLKIDSGEIFAFIGHNGAGKTTLLRMIAGIMEPTSGEILIDNKTYQECMIGIKKKIAFLSGNTKLYKDISPYELLEMAGNYYEVDQKTL